MIRLKTFQKRFIESRNALRHIATLYLSPSFSLSTAQEIWKYFEFICLNIVYAKIVRVYVAYTKAGFLLTARSTCAKVLFDCYYLLFTLTVSSECVSQLRCKHY